MLGEEIERVRTRYGKFYVPKRDNVIGRSLRLYGEWAEHEITTLSAFLEDGPTIIDVGANIGCHSAAFSARFPTSKVIAIEPNPLAYAFLAANMVSNNYGGVAPQNIACGHAAGVMNVQFKGLESQDEGFNLGANSLASVKLEADVGRGKSLPILVRPLDDIASGETVQFIKIDVEGMEDQVLAGSRSMLARDRPIVFFEVLELQTLWACRDILAPDSYDLYWLESSAYNCENFLGSNDNIWSRCEMGVLAMPTGLRKKVDLPPVTGHETAIPFVRNPAVGWSPNASASGENV